MVLWAWSAVVLWAEGRGAAGHAAVVLWAEGRGAAGHAAAVL